MSFGHHAISSEPISAIRPIVVIEPTGIPSSAAVGSPTIEQVVSVTGITSSEAIGQPTINQVVTPTGIPSSEALGTVTAEQVVTMTGIPSSEALGSFAIQSARPFRVSRVRGPTGETFVK